MLSRPARPACTGTPRPAHHQAVGARSLPAAGGGAHLSDHPRLGPALGAGVRGPAPHAQSRGAVALCWSSSRPRFFLTWATWSASSRRFSEKVAVGAAGGLGLAFTVATCYFLYDTVENTFNDIWHVSVRRSRFRKFLSFYPVVTLLRCWRVPILLVRTPHWIGAAGAFLCAAVHSIRGTFPDQLDAANIRVRWHAALAGTLVTGFALEGLKWGFVHFAKGVLLSSYSGVYGPWRSCRLILLWIYISCGWCWAAPRSRTPSRIAPARGRRTAPSRRRAHQRHDRRADPGFRRGGLPAGRQGHRSRRSWVASSAVGGCHRSHRRSAQEPRALGGSARRQGRLSSRAEPRAASPCRTSWPRFAQAIWKPRQAPRLPPWPP